MMKNLSVYLPTAKMFVAVLIVLVVTTFILRQLPAGNTTVVAIKKYLGLFV